VFYFSRKCVKLSRVKTKLTSIKQGLERNTTVMQHFLFSRPDNTNREGKFMATQNRHSLPDKTATFSLDISL
jgi:hypothetical protein